MSLKAPIKNPTINSERSISRLSIVSANETARGKKKSEILAFFRRDSFCIRDAADWARIVEKSVKGTTPLNTSTAYCLISILNILENTRVETLIISSGFNNVHKYPRRVLRYRMVICCLTSSDSKYQLMLPREIMGNSLIFYYTLVRRKEQG